MTKGIHIVAHRGDLSEFLPEIPLGVQRLPKEGFAGGGVHVRLDPHTAHNPPASLRHPPADLFEHGGIVFLHPLIVAGAGTGKDKIRCFVQAIQRRTEGGHGLVITVSPLPKPDGVQMGVADHVHGLHSFSPFNFVFFAFGFIHTLNVWILKGLRCVSICSFSIFFPSTSSSRLHGA